MPLAALTIRGVQDTNQQIIALLNENGIDTIEIPEGLTKEEQLEMLKPCDAILCGTEPYDEETLNQLPNLKILARQGVGIDQIDVAACKARGIKVAKAVGAVEVPVSELIMAMMLHFSRNLIEMNEAMHDHRWQPMLGEGLLGKRIGLIGFGGIGKEVAKKAAAFSMNISYYTRYRDERDTIYRATYTPLPRLLEKNDYIVVNVPLTKETYHMIGEAELRQMRPNGVLINTSRGDVVDQDALAKALKEGVIRGAGVDVYPEEPTTNSPLMDCPNAVLTPHVGTYTARGVLDMGKKAAWHIIDTLMDHK